MDKLTNLPKARSWHMALLTNLCFRLQSYCFLRIAFHIKEDRFLFCFLHYPNIQISICHPLIREWAAHLPWQIWSVLPPDANLRQPWKFKKITQLRHPKVTMCFRITEALITYIAVSLFFAPPQMVIDLNSVSPTAVFLSTLCSRASN